MLQIVHVMVGFVRSSVVTTAVQVYSRVFILWPICHLVEASQMSKGIPLILIAWSVTEMIRYSFYFLNILKMAPYFLIYLRYTLFIALYPIGVTGELLCLYTALPYIAKTKMFTYTMPNLFNFTFDFYYCCIITMFLYIPSE
ncbi:UNVERIFIED_CONTAM: hypothetical protein GTU68_005624 [Idotea baltica]|nr:hypothetical protein [Idotea baltica]